MKGAIMSLRKRLAVGAATATIGLVLGATVLAPVVAGAQESTTTTTNEAVSPDGTRTTERVDRIRNSLEELVTDGTITSEQADAVAEHLAEYAPGPGHHGPGHFLVGFGVVAGTIGIEPSVLIDALREGQTIAEVAVANGSSAQAVMDALVSANQARLDELVTDGVITAEEASERASEAVERITALVNGDFEFRPFSGPGHDHEESTVTEGA
jgi:polyhydroxyalkanoate synthesis regulator phasin